VLVLTETPNKLAWWQQQKHYLSESTLAMLVFSCTWLCASYLPRSNWLLHHPFIPIRTSKLEKMHPEKGVVHDTESYLYRQARPRHARIVHLYDTITHDLVKKKVGPGQCQSYHSYQDTVKLSNFTKLHQQVYPEFLAGNRVI